MGDEDKDLEARASNISRYALKFLRKAAFTVGVGSALGLLYVYALDRELPSLERLKDSALSWGAYRNAIITASALAGAATGGLFLANRRRKKKGKKPLRLFRLALRRLIGPKIPEEEKGYLETLEMWPESSMTYFALATHYMKNNRLIEALDAYYSALKYRDKEWIPKIPLAGPFEYRESMIGKEGELRRHLEKNPNNNKDWLNLAMRYFLVNDFGNAIECFEHIDTEQDPIALHVLASRFYDEIRKRADKPKVRWLSFGDSCVGRAVDKSVYFWDRKRPGKDEMGKKAEQEALAAVDGILSTEGIERKLEPIGDYNVYRVPLNRFVKGFVVLKQGDCAKLQNEMEHERIFEERVAGTGFKSVHPIDIVEHDGKYYLVLLHEDGKPLAESKNPNHFKRAMEFAAKSDALMPIDKVLNPEYDPKAHFAERLAGLDDRLGQEIAGNSEFLFRYSGAFPVVFDGDWHSLNCLFDEDGLIIGLDKEGKGVTIGPVTAARVANHGERLEGHPTAKDQLKDLWVDEVYLPTYQDHASRDMRIADTGLFIPHMMAKIMEKAITAYIFNFGKQTMHGHTRAFLHNAVHAGQRIRYEFRDFYSEKERKQCQHLEAAIHQHLLS